MKKIKTFLELIKFEHSIFALPFAYLGLILAEGGLPRIHIFFWVTVAMVAIRSAGMCLNRLIDEPIDQKNPRTQGRITQMNLLKRPLIWALTVCALALFVLSAARLNPVCLRLSPIPIFLVVLYPYLKRFTWCSHLILGIILGIAPYGGWLASSGQWSWIPFLLTLAVTCWVSGFDMFYALQDVPFDREQRLKSFPAVFGVDRTVWVVKVLHGITVGLLGIFGVLSQMGAWYWLSWTAVVILIFREHRLISRFGIGKLNEAFFNMNAWVSVIIFLGVILDLLF